VATVPEFLAAVLLAGCCLGAPACHTPADPDHLLAVSEQMGQQQRALNYPPSSSPETGHG
jgi:hypothetical protein